jgi:hypothetical protein
MFTPRPAVVPEPFDAEVVASRSSDLDEGLAPEPFAAEVVAS